MKSPIIAIALLLASGFSPGEGAAAAQGREIIVVDSAHSQAGQASGKEGLKYSLRPGLGVTVDARAFDFTHSLDPKVRPNAIQLVVGKDRHYSAAWNPSGLTTLSAANLTPLNGSVAFGGLKAGDSAILAIGGQRVDPVKKKIILEVLWVGMIDVR